MKKADEIAIKVEHVGKTFELQSSSRTIKEAFISLGRKITGKRKLTHHKGEYTALRDISFEVKKGDFFGIVGKNGCGKSTLLKILAGVYTPSEGTVQINGKLTPFIELGVGFNPELSGRDNVFLNGALLGFTRQQMEEMYDDIVDFAELHDFMDTKLKNYSSGMQVRLAFSVAIRAESDILLIDEVLAVGDAAFQQKCYDYFNELRARKKTVIFVSHDIGALEKFCTKGLLIDKGLVVESGGMREVLDSYNSIVGAEIAKESDVHEEIEDDSYASISDVSIQDLHDIRNKVFKMDDAIYISFTIKVKKTLPRPIIGVTLWKKGVTDAILATNTVIDRNPLGIIKANTSLKVSLKIDNTRLNNGRYYIEPAIANESGTYFYSRKPYIDSFTVTGSNNPHSILGATNKLSIIKEEEHVKP